MIQNDANTTGPTTKRTAGEAAGMGGGSSCFQPPPNTIYRGCEHALDTPQGTESWRPAPIPMLLWCPACGDRHIDDGEFATKPHHTHACQGCGMVWRPAIVPTVGVEFLPGFKNEPVGYGVEAEVVAGFACPNCGEILSHWSGHQIKGMDLEGYRCKRADDGVHVNRIEPTYPPPEQGKCTPVKTPICRNVKCGRLTAEDMPWCCAGCPVHVGECTARQYAATVPDGAAGNDLRERLAALCHEQWTGWMKYVYGRLVLQDGTADAARRLIPLADFDRWLRQQHMSYAELSEAEKENDRKEADRFLAVLCEVAAPPAGNSADDPAMRAAMEWFHGGKYTYTGTLAAIIREAYAPLTAENARWKRAMAEHEECIGELEYAKENERLKHEALDNERCIDDLRQQDGITKQQNAALHAELAGMKTETETNRLRNQHITYVAKKYGWNGVENSKLVWEFFDSLIGGRDFTIAQLRGTVHALHADLATKRELIADLNLQVEVQKGYADELAVSRLGNESLREEIEQLAERLSRSQTCHYSDGHPGDCIAEDGRRLSTHQPVGTVTESDESLRQCSACGHTTPHAEGSVKACEWLAAFCSCRAEFRDRAERRIARERGTHICDMAIDVDLLHSGKHVMLFETERLYRPERVKRGWQWCIGCDYTRPSVGWCEGHKALDACWAQTDGVA